MNPSKKSRFTLSDAPDYEEVSGEERGSRFTFAGSGRKGLSFLRDKKIPFIIASTVALTAIAGIIYLTQFVYKKPHTFTKKTGGETVFSGSEKKDIPDSATQNPHLIRGKESYYKGYLNDAIAEFKEVVESGAPDEEKAVALTFIGIIYDDKGDYKSAIDHYQRAIKYDRKNPITYRNLALAYRHLKDYEKAGEAISRAVDLDEKNTNNRVLYGNILFDQGKYKEARDQYEGALKTNPENPSALYNLAITLIRTGDEVSAMEYLKRASAADKIGEVAHLSHSKLGVLYSQMKDFDSAEKHLRMAISVNPKDPVDRYNLGYVYLQRKEPEKAIEEFKKSEEMAAGDVRLLENLGEAYFNLRDYDRSADAYQKLLAINRRNVKVLSRIAEIYYEKGELDKAYEFYKKITTMEPASENARIAYLNMGNILDDTQQYNEAVDAYKKALAISPKDDSAYHNLGIAYKHAGTPELAIEAWKKASELNPDNPKPLMALADFYYEKGNYDMAMDEYQRLLRRWPNIQDGHFNLATIYYKKNMLDYALEEYKRVIEINERNDFARKANINLGVLTAKRSGNSEQGTEQALSYIQKALLMKPDDPEALFSLAVIYSKREMYEQAVDTFFQVVKSSRESKLVGDAYNNIGKCYYRMKQYKKALQAFNRGVEEDPTNEEIRINRTSAMQAYEAELERR